MFKCENIKTGEVFMTGGKYLYDAEIDCLKDIQEEIDLCDTSLKTVSPFLGKKEDLMEKKRNLLVLKRMMKLEEVML